MIDDIAPEPSSFRLLSRREFLTGIGAVAVQSGFGAARSAPFILSVLTDEISQDFAHACEIAAREFGLGWVELRAMHDRNVMNWDDNDIAHARGILRKFNLRVSEIASPVFKTDWPGAPKSPYSPRKPEFGADFTFEQQNELIDKSIELAKALETTRVRIFDFWRLDDQAPHRNAIDDRLRQAALRAARKGMTLTLENEMACNTATGAEAGRLLGVVREASLMLNWDPGNAAASGETPFPDGYGKIPKGRIAHMHCKDVSVVGKTAWAPMGKGVIDYVGQFRALIRDGYTGPVSLETHWRGAGTPEKSTRQSMAGLKMLVTRAEQP